jgi:hypothetical protein
MEQFDGPTFGAEANRTSRIHIAGRALVSELGCVSVFYHLLAEPIV